MAEARGQRTPGRAAEDLDRLVREEEREAERVVALARLAVVVALALVFNVAVPDPPADADVMLARQHELALGTLAAYALLGVVSLALSHPRVHRRFFGFVFVTLDVVFLVASLELALLNTRLSAEFTAALPSVWLVPVILSFGAMRYAPWLQIWCTVLLVFGLGWLFDPVALPPEAEAVRGSALAAMFAHPPNVMRVAMVALAGVVLVVAIMRARRLLTRALSQERRRQSLTRYLPPEVARLVEEAAADELRAGRRQEVVVMFVDIRGFTGRTEAMPPEAVGAFLARFRSELSAAARDCGGVIDKFIGDGAIILFGVPDARPDDAARAVACGRLILERIARWSDELASGGEAPVRVGVGIHGGEVFVGAVGDEERLEFTVLGDVVNVASRVEEMTRGLASDLVVTDAVLAAAGDGGPSWRTVPAMPVRGRTRPVVVWAFEPPAAVPGRPA